MILPRWFSLICHDFQVERHFLGAFWQQPEHDVSTRWETYVFIVGGVIENMVMPH